MRGPKLGILDVDYSGEAPLYAAAWYAPCAEIGTQATRHCDGTTPLAGEPAMVRLEGTSVGGSIDWNADGDDVDTVAQDINFDGVDNDGAGDPPRPLLAGFNDWANLRLNQIGARRNIGVYFFADGFPYIGPASLGMTGSDFGKFDFGKFDFGGGGGGDGTNAELTTGLAVAAGLFGPPTGLTACVAGYPGVPPCDPEPAGQGLRVLLEWGAPDASPSAYVVYRRLEGDPCLSTCGNGVPSSAMTFVDSTVEFDRTCVYYVAARYEAEGEVSESASNIAEVTIGPQFYVLVPVRNLPPRRQATGSAVPVE